MSRHKLGYVKSCWGGLDEPAGTSALLVLFVYRSVVAKVLLKATCTAVG